MNKVSIKSHAVQRIPLQLEVDSFFRFASFLKKKMYLCLVLVLVFAKVFFFYILYDILVFCIFLIYSRAASLELIINIQRSNLSFGVCVLDVSYEVST